MDFKYARKDAALEATRSGKEPGNTFSFSELPEDRFDSSSVK